MLHFNDLNIKLSKGNNKYRQGVPLTKKQVGKHCSRETRYLRDFFPNRPNRRFDCHVGTLSVSNFEKEKKLLKLFINPRYIKVKVEHYLLFMFSPPKISWVVSGIKYICLHLLPVFYLIQPSSEQSFVLISENKIVCYLQYSMYLV